MDLSRPAWLWLLLPWALAVLGTRRMRRRRAAAWESLGQSGKPPRDGAVAGLMAAMLLIVALAGPRWGRNPGAAIPPGRDVVLLIDVSRSMAAEDASPSRLGAAVESARGLIRALGREEGDRVAVVAFAGAGVVRCGLTENLGAAADVVARLRPGSVRPGGTDLGAAIGTAIAAFDDRDHADGRLIVVFTDGEDHTGGWRRAIARLREAGIVLIAVAIGDADAGHPVPSGEAGLALSYQGRPVLSRRSDEALDALAGATGGEVVRLGTASADMGALHESRIAPAARRARLATHPPDRAPRHAPFVLAALALLTIGTGPWPSRPPARRRASAATTALALALATALGAGPARESPRRLVDRGRVAYNARYFDEALAAFEAAAESAPASPVPRFDAGATLFALGRYPEAIASYRLARDLGDPAIRLKADYALGNAALMADDPAQAVRHYDACIASPVRSPRLDAIRRDAVANREYARRRAEEEADPDPDDIEKPESRPKPAPPAPAPVGQGDGPEAPGPRGKGGAGGDEPDPRPSGGPSPEDRLGRALDHIREARAHRPPDPTAGPPSPGFKDW